MEGDLQDIEDREEFKRNNKTLFTLFYPFAFSYFFHCSSYFLRNLHKLSELGVLNFDWSDIFTFLVFKGKLFSNSRASV